MFLWHCFKSQGHVSLVPGSGLEMFLSLAQVSVQGVFLSLALGSESWCSGIGRFSCFHWSFYPTTSTYTFLPPGWVSERVVRSLNIENNFQVGIHSVPPEWAVLARQRKNWIEGRNDCYGKRKACAFKDGTASRIQVQNPPRVKQQILS